MAVDDSKWTWTEFLRYFQAENSIVAMGADGIPKVALYRRLGKREGSGGASLEGSSSLSSPHSYEPPEQYAKIIDTEQVRDVCAFIDVIY